VPIGESRTGFFKLKSREDIVFSGDLKTMTKYAIGVGRGYANSEEFDNADYLNKKIQDSTINCLKMLWVKRLELVAGGELIERYNMIHLLEPTYNGINEGIVFMEPPLQVQYLHMAVSKKAPDYVRKLEAFNIGMRKIMLDGTYKKIMKKHGVD